MLVNDNGSRTFLGVAPSTGADAICALIRKASAVMVKHRLQPFYEPAQPHVSVCWWPGDVRPQIHAALPALQQRWAATLMQWPTQVRLRRSCAWTFCVCPRLSASLALQKQCCRSRTNCATHNMRHGLCRFKKCS